MWTTKSIVHAISSTSDVRLPIRQPARRCGTRSRTIDGLRRRRHARRHRRSCRRRRLALLPSFGREPHRSRSTQTAAMMAVDQLDVDDVDRGGRSFAQARRRDVLRFLAGKRFEDDFGALGERRPGSIARLVRAATGRCVPSRVMSPRSDACSPSAPTFTIVHAAAPAYSRRASSAPASTQERRRGRAAVKRARRRPSASPSRPPWEAPHSNERSCYQPRAAAIIHVHDGAMDSSSAAAWRDSDGNVQTREDKKFDNPSIREHRRHQRQRGTATAPPPRRREQGAERQERQGSEPGQAGDALLAQSEEGLDEADRVRGRLHKRCVQKRGPAAEPRNAWSAEAIVPRADARAAAGPPRRDEAR